MGALLVSGWNLDPTLVIGIGGLALLYVLPFGRDQEEDADARTRRWRTVSFFAGVAVLVLALISPLDTLADRYLFSAHMVQHLLLLLVAPVFLLLGAPKRWFTWLLTWTAVGWVLRRIGRPLPAFLLYEGATWLWHVPVIYEAALANESIHVGEHLCFLGTALLFWWPICRARTHPEPMPELISLAYLFGAALGSTALAALLTFATEVLYPTYSAPGPDRAVQAALGISPLVDQQIGGLVMWIAGVLWILGAALIIFIRWFEGPGQSCTEQMATASHR